MLWRRTARLPCRLGAAGEALRRLRARSLCSAWVRRRDTGVPGAAPNVGASTAPHGRRGRGRPRRPGAGMGAAAPSSALASSPARARQRAAGPWRGCALRIAGRPRRRLARRRAAARHAALARRGGTGSPVRGPAFPGGGAAPRRSSVAPRHTAARGAATTRRTGPGGAGNGCLGAQALAAQTRFPGRARARSGGRLRRAR